ncbi:MAG: cupin-like domain-containing protein [Pseudomonadota bacterium]|nr:cupin-like domain-containing protein [Pseudomonadota bacterium]
MDDLTPIRELAGPVADALTDERLRDARPWVQRGLAAHWPMVQAARRSTADAMAYLKSTWRGELVGMLLAPPQTHGRFFYDDTLTGMNFKREKAPLDVVLDALAQMAGNPQAPALYVGSTTVDTCLPGFRAANDLPLGDRDPLVSIWLGNRSRISAHFDLPDNLACVVAGRRRFTLFPPEQLANLYVGPLDVTPAGQAVSLVDFANPDFERFPRFAQALAHAQVVELEPGDAVFIPSMWWHHVESLTDFNVLINYWWRQSPDYMDSPIGALMAALLTMRDLPPAQREIWRGLFDHYVFQADETTAAHIPPHARSALAPLTESGARHLRQALLTRFKR